MSCTWSNTGHKSGSRWPTMGVSIACKTRGCTLLGPGPSKIRFGKGTLFTEAFMDACPPSKDGRDGGGRRLERTRAHSQNVLSTGAACSTCTLILQDCADPTPSLYAALMPTTGWPG